MFLRSYKTLFKAAPTHFNTTTRIGVMSVSHNIASAAEIEASEIVEENNAAMRAVEDVVDL